MINKMKKLIVKVFDCLGFEIRRKKTKRAVVFDYRKYLQTDKSEFNKNKRALVSYLVNPLLISPQRIKFSNDGIALAIPRVLNELGYIVDVVNWDDLNFVPEKKYNLFIGHGGCNFEQIARNLSSNAVKIYFSMGIYWKECNQREAERFCQLKQRRGRSLPYDRWITYSEEYANCSADAIICLGNEYAKESYLKFPFTLNLNNAAYPDDRYDRTMKNFVSARNNFLFFSGGGNVHKGLDLLLEAFVQVNDAHLYICQSISSDFYEVYRHEFEDHPNIHLIGPLKMRSSKFYKLMDKCAFVIHPSCAEGQQGSVIECMLQGLIPMVSRDTNMDVNDFGIMLNTCCIKEIVETVQDLSQRSPKWCKETSQRTHKIAITDYSEETFLSNLRNHIKHIIEKASAK
ncbi:MAG: glycosyltransferase [bacterium]|nr:glycosyltransferase [bacterium]